MAQIREISSRIASIKSTQKITRAMKMVAAARLNRAQARMDSIRKYSYNVARVLTDINSNLFGDEHPLLKARPAIKRELFIVIAGDRGLCGGFNSNIARYVTQAVPPGREIPAKFYCVGRRAISIIRKLYGDNAMAHEPWVDIFDKTSFALTNDIAKNLLASYQQKAASKRFDAVNAICNTFASRMKQEVVTMPLMPLNLDALKADAAKASTPASPSRLVYDILPSVEEAITELVEHYLSTQLFHAITESYAAELSARVNAMESATNSAQEMIDEMTLLYNRARQAGITNELLDIIGGANAL